MSHNAHGPCAHCATLNSYSAFDCRGCGARLPWADALTQKLLEGQQAAQTLALANPQGGAPLATPQWTGSPVLQTQQAAQTPAPARQAFCAHCGAPNASQAAYCSGCGTRILSQPAPDSHKTRTIPLWPFGNRAPAAASATPAATLAPANAPSHSVAPYAASASGAPNAPYLSPQQNVNVNVVTHRQDTQIQQKQKRGGGGRFAWRVSLLFFMAATAAALLNPRELIYAFWIAVIGAFVLLLRALW